MNGTETQRFEVLFPDSIFGYVVNWDWKGSIAHFQTFYMLLIYIFHFATDENLRKIKGSKLFLPFENSILFNVFHKINSDLKFRFIS